jgi:hypothetical protein
MTERVKRVRHTILDYFNVSSEEHEFYRLNLTLIMSPSRMR